MTLNENKLKKGKRLNKKHKNRKSLGTINYQLDQKESLVSNNNLHIRDMIDYEEKKERKEKKRTQKKVKKKIKIEKKKDLMEGLLIPVNEKIKDHDPEMIIEEPEINIESDLSLPESKKDKKKEKKETKTIKIEEIKQEGGIRDMNNNKKKIVITSDLKPEAKKGELVI